MIVLKFGGSSIGSGQNIQKVKGILSKQGEPFIAIISATSGTTDQLQVLAKLALEGKYKEALESLKKRQFNLLRELLNPANQTDVIIFTLKLFNQLENICNSIFTIKELSDKTLSYVLSFGERLTICIIYSEDNTLGLFLETAHPGKFGSVVKKAIPTYSIREVSLNKCSKATINNSYDCLLQEIKRITTHGD